MEKQFNQLYETPEVGVYQVNPKSVLAASGPLNGDGASFEQYQDGDFSWN